MYIYFKVSSLLLSHSVELLLSFNPSIRYSGIYNEKTTKAVCITEGVQGAIKTNSLCLKVDQKLRLEGHSFCRHVLGLK
jgi:hypothetical protein